jgi:hypothetical protein
VYGGDILLTPEQREVLEGTSKPSERGPAPAVYGGDILLTPKQREVVEGKPSGRAHSSAVARHAFSLWPNGVVPYILDRSLSGRYIKWPVKTTQTKTVDTRGENIDICQNQRLGCQDQHRSKTLTSVLQC